MNKNDRQDSEGNDRVGLGLPYGQDKLINELAKVNKNLAVVLISGNVVAMPWANEVPSIVQGWYLGTESGNAIASVLVGDVNPSGKLPFTFPVKLEDNAAHAVGEYPGDGEETYKEGIFVGYRWSDKNNIKPLFSFGHGLSYTTFEYGKISVDKKQISEKDMLRITIPIKNTGKMRGSEVVQLYISDLKSSMPRPIKELKGFAKIDLNPGETKNVSFEINKDALQFFNDQLHAWVAEPGEFEVLIGASSTDIRDKASFEFR